MKKLDEKGIYKYTEIQAKSVRSRGNCGQRKEVEDIVYWVMLVD